MICKTVSIINYLYESDAVHVLRPNPRDSITGFVLPLAMIYKNTTFKAKVFNLKARKNLVGIH